MDLLATPAELAAMPGCAHVPRPTAKLLLEIATGVVQAFVGQRLVAVDHDELHIDLDTQGVGPWLHLPEQPVTAVHAVRIDDQPVTDYAVQLGRARLWRACGWDHRFRHDGHWWPEPRRVPVTVTVVYDHGYPPGHHRLQLARSAVLMLASGVAKEPGGISSESIGDYSATYQQMTERLEASPFLETALRRRYARTRFGSLRFDRTT